MTYVAQPYSTNPFEANYVPQSFQNKRYSIPEGYPPGYGKDIPQPTYPISQLQYRPQVTSLNIPVQVQVPRVVMETVTMPVSVAVTAHMPEYTQLVAMPKLEANPEYKMPKVTNGFTSPQLKMPEINASKATNTQRPLCRANYRRNDDWFLYLIATITIIAIAIITACPFAIILI